MIYALAFALYLATVAGFLWVLARKDEQHSLDLKLSLDLLTRQLDSEREERHLMAERIQRPQFTPTLPSPPVEDEKPGIYEDQLHLAGSIILDNGQPEDDAA